MLDEHVQYRKDSVSLRLFRIQKVANLQKNYILDNLKTWRKKLWEIFVKMGASTISNL